MNNEFWAKIERLAGEADDQRSLRPWTPMHIGEDRGCESPIERQLLEWLTEFSSRWGYEVISRFEIDRYRYDFALKNKVSGDMVAVIECDGREFHATKQQRANDAAKDALARSKGFIVHRYAGTKIWRDAKKVAEEIIFNTYPR